MNGEHKNLSPFFLDGGDSEQSDYEGFSDLRIDLSVSDLNAPLSLPPPPQHFI